MWDIDGAVAGTGGAGIKMYRNMKQLEATEKYQQVSSKATPVAYRLAVVYCS